MKKESNFKELLKISFNCGLGVIGVIAVYSLLSYGFHFISEQVTSKIFPVVIPTLSLIIIEIKEYIIANLNFITISWILFSLWFLCIGFKTIESFGDVPKIIKIFYIIFIPVGVIIAFFNIFSNEILYFMFIIILILFSCSIYQYNPKSDPYNDKNKKDEDDKQQKFDF